MNEIKSFFNNYANFQGKATKREFFVPILAYIGVFFILMLFNQYLYRENFSNYLFPIKGLTKECKGNLKPAYMPTSCVIDGKLKPFSNFLIEKSNPNAFNSLTRAKKESGIEGFGLSTSFLIKIDS